MRYNDSQLLQEDAGATRRYDLEVPPYRIDEGVDAVAPLTGSVKLNRTNRGILADADVATELRFECSRCLDEVTKRCPAEGCKNKRLPLAPLIVHLNDDHRWTREQIADWLTAESM